ncbi:Periplasmic nitrate reductase [Xyrichtys novacula]|uniref:Periplasmic nitrate reductase n=1 Tax=Xyrichtys novacula TaxID=13765 RepID=A0AAV1EPR6_XYRNO|nr:Periplasmic nitrate reductase [Xyrichtys novacula]
MAQNAAKPRAGSFSAAEQNLLMELYDDYRDIITKKATKKKAQLGATGGGPPPEEFTQAKFLALSYNKGPKIDGIQGGRASSPIDPAIRATFVEGTVLSTTIPPLHGDSPSVDLADC